MLCTLCKGFDIKALYELALDRAQSSKPSTGPLKTVLPSFEGFPEFYKHHANLKACMVPPKVLRTATAAMHMNMGFLGFASFVA